MKSIKFNLKTNIAIQESKNIKSATNIIKKILDANYEKANLREITNKLKYLNSDKHFLIYRLLKNMKICLMTHWEIIPVPSIKLNF